MSNNFMGAVKKTLDNEYNVSVTENGAVGYRTSGKELLDLNFAVASLRGAPPQEIAKRFVKAFYEDKITAMKWLFFARDVRGGLGERKLFRAVLADMARNASEYIIPLIDLIPEYGRYDDLWCLLDTKLRERVLMVVGNQLMDDRKNAKAGKSISLLAKWLPSRNASSAQTKHYAKIIYDGLGMSEGEYRKMLSALRRHLKVVERQMSAKEWGEINYEAVPSRANLIYNAAFLRNDEERRRAFLASLEKGEAKINASTLYPHDIVHKYGYASGIDTTLEQLWKALPDTVGGCGNTIVVADGSGSMTVNVGGGTNTRAIDVANALAIYFAERSSGQFKDQYITFSENPQLVDLSKGKNLRDKLRIAYSHNEVANTNIEAVFDLILTTAINNHMEQEELPQNILIVSDMEFDSCATCGRPTNRRGWGYTSPRPTTRLFDEIAERYKNAGYKLPRLVFWNVNSRTGTIPVKENDMGVALVSGFSVNIVKMVMSGQLDPYECLLETLNTERYEPIAKALEGV